MKELLLPNGARIVYEKNDFIKSVTFGVWVASGARHESAALSGISHYMEHMLFKGTEKHNCTALSEAFDSLGGHVNAYTTKELTAYYAKCVDNRLSETVSLLMEMLLMPAFDQAAIDSERGVITEEIGMYEDDPEDLATERLSEIVYPSSSLGRPILGTRASIKRIGRDRLFAYQKEKYVGANTVAALSGHFEESDLDKLAALLGQLPCGRKNEITQADYRPAAMVKKRKYEQNHFGIVFPSYGVQDERKYAVELLSAILGDGASSRLFRRVREEDGLCYSIYAYNSATAMEGLFGIYTATGKETEEKALRATMDEVKKLRKNGVDREELQRAKDKLCTELLFGMESTGTRASFLARNLLYFGRVPSYDEIIAGYQAVTPEDLHAVAEEILDTDKLSFAAIGRCEKEEYYKEILA